METVSFPILKKAYRFNESSMGPKLVSMNVIQQDSSSYCYCECQGAIIAVETNKLIYEEDLAGIGYK